MCAVGDLELVARYQIWATVLHNVEYQSGGGDTLLLVHALYNLWLTLEREKIQTIFWNHELKVNLIVR